MASLMDESYSYGMEKLTYEIFSILENKFLSSPIDHNRGKVRILSIDAGDDDCLLAAASLSRLESSLRSRSNNPNASVADFFDVAAGSGLGGVLVAMLFTRGPDGKPLFSAEESLHFLTNNRNHFEGDQRSSVLKRIIFRRSNKGILSRMFGGGLTLRDTLKPVLIPCYDLSTGAPFLFSRADAMETDAYDFSISRICAATCADRRPVEVRSADGHTKIVAQGGGVATNNPTAAAITHVLNNKREFPFAAGVDDLLVLSLGSTRTVSARADKLKIAANAAADTVDQAVGTEFGDNENYVRVQESLAYKNLQSSLFREKRISQLTNADKLDEFCGKLVKEEERRISSPIPNVCIIKQAMSPRTSSATTCTTSTASSTDDSCC